MSYFIIVNGEVIDGKEINLSHLLLNNRVEICQKCWFGFGGIPLLNKNLERLEQQLEAVNIPLPDFFQNKREVFRVTKRMLNKNMFYRSGIVRFTIFMQKKQVTSIITSHAFKTFDFSFPVDGILVNYSSFKKQGDNQLNLYHFFNQPLWDAALAQLKDTYYLNSIFLNENHSACDCINANIFFIHNKTLITPSLKTGCFNDTIRNIILKIAAEINLKVVESENIQPEDILKMNEIFIAGEESGMHWVMGVESKRYVHHYSIAIHEKLNAYLKNIAV